MDGSGAESERQPLGRVSFSKTLICGLKLNGPAGFRLQRPRVAAASLWSLEGPGILSRLQGCDSSAGWIPPRDGCRLGSPAVSQKVGGVGSGGRPPHLAGGCPGDAPRLPERCGQEASATAHRDQRNLTPFTKAVPPGCPRGLLLTRGWC